MNYYVKFNDITSMQGQTNQTIQQWGASITNLSKAVEGFAGNKAGREYASVRAQQTRWQAEAMYRPLALWIENYSDRKSVV